MSDLIDWSPDSDYEIRETNKPFGLTDKKWKESVLKAMELARKEQEKML
jgi:hypothetical protein